MAEQKSPTPYVDKARLKYLVADAQSTGKASEELGAVLIQMANGIYAKYHFVPDRGEYVGEVLVHLLGRPLQRCDPANNPFSFFTTCAIYFGSKLRKKHYAQLDRLRAYRDVVADVQRRLDRRHSHVIRSAAEEE